MATPSAPEMVSCPSHPGEEIVFVCSVCGDVFACSKCVTSVHRGHVLNSVQEKAKSLSEQIPGLVRTRTTDAETVAKRLDDIKVDYDQTTDNLRNLIVEVTLRRTKVKAMLDEIADKVLQCIQDLLHDNEANVTDYRTKLHELENQLRYITKDKTESVFLFGNATEIISHFKDLAIPPIFPRCPPFRRAKFTSAQLVIEDLGQTFGTFAEHQIKRRESAQGPPPRPPRTKSESVPMVVPQAELIPSRKIKSERRVTKNSAKDSTSELHSPRLTKSERRSSSTSNDSLSSSTKDVLPELRELAHIQEESSFRIRSLCYNEKNFMISYKSDRRLIFVNEEGEKTRKVRVMSNIMDACISSLTGNAWICCEDHSVMEIGPQTKTVRFKTESLSPPLCICAQHSGTVLIGVNNEVIKYNIDGKVLHRTRYLGANLTYPWLIRENPGTGEIAVSHGYEMERASKVNFLDRELKFIFQFPNEKHPQEDFAPGDICFTPDGELLVLDTAANKLVWVGSHGMALRETLLHQYRPSVMTLGPGNQLCFDHQTLTSQILTTDLFRRTGRNEYTYTTF